MPTTLEQPAISTAGYEAHDDRYGAHPFTGPVLEVPGLYDGLSMHQRDLLALIEHAPRLHGVSVLSLRHAVKIMGVRKLDVLRYIEQLQNRRIIFTRAFSHTAAKSKWRGCTVTPGGEPIALAEKPMHCMAIKPWTQHGDLPAVTCHRLADTLIEEGRA